MTSQFRHKHPGDPYTFTTPLERRIPRPGPSRLTELERRVEALEAEHWRRPRTTPFLVEIVPFKDES